jgi:ligand-binding SRPBCC domain-containing protein
MSREGRLVDVVVEIDVARPRAEVAAYASDPDRAMSWYKNIKSVEWKTERPAAVGSRIAFIAQFLGRRLAYTYEVTAIEPGERFVMSTVDGPFPMETTYQWRDSGDGTTMTLRNRGRASGFSRLLAPFLGPAMRRANRQDLARLQSVLEASGPPTTL